MQTREYDDYIASGFGGYRFQTWRNMRINQLSEVLTNVQTNPNNVKFFGVGLCASKKHRIWQSNMATDSETASTKYVVSIVFLPIP